MLSDSSSTEVIRVDGAAVRVSRSGSFHPGPPILLINGIGARLEMWRPLIAELYGRPTLAFDLPGISGQPAFEPPMLMPDLAIWLTHLMDVEGVERADVLGYSWGGVLAQQLAKDAPSRVRGLVLAATNYGFGSPTRPSLAQLDLLNVWPRNNWNDPWQLLVAALGGDPTDRNVVRGMTSSLNPLTTNVVGYFRQLYALGGWTSLPWLHTLHTPTLIVTGENDAFIPVTVGRRLSQAIPHAEFVLLPGADHMLPINRPAQVAGAVEVFLRRVAARELFPAEKASRPG